MKRLLGSLLIIRGLTPILAPVLMAYVVFGLLYDLQSAIGGPLTTIQVELAKVEESYQAASVDWQRLQNDIGALTAQIDSFQVPNLVPDLPDTLTVPLHIPDAAVPVPAGVDVQFANVGVDRTEVENVCLNLGPFSSFCEDVTKTVTDLVRYPNDVRITTGNFTIDMPAVDLALPVGMLRDAFQPLEALLSDMQTLFNSLDLVVTGFRDLQQELQKLPALLQHATQAGETLFNQVFAILLNVGGWRLIVLAFAALLVLISLGTILTADLRNGFRLLMEKNG